MANTPNSADPTINATSHHDDDDGAPPSSIHLPSPTPPTSTRMITTTTSSSINILPTAFSITLTTNAPLAPPSVLGTKKTVDDPTSPKKVNFDNADVVKTVPRTPSISTNAPLSRITTVHGAPASTVTNLGAAGHDSSAGGPSTSANLGWASDQSASKLKLQKGEGRMSTIKYGLRPDASDIPLLTRLYEQVEKYAVPIFVNVENQKVIVSHRDFYGHRVVTSTYAVKSNWKIF